MNNLDPLVLHRGRWTPSEDHALAQHVLKEGSSTWAGAATALPARTDNQVYNRLYITSKCIYILSQTQKRVHVSRVMCSVKGVGNSF